ncbi:2-oxoglutarate dehydrogenase complex dihydrolipoyllysine-residue succinyltransferase [Empedobacter stercoris]|uniref:Dihydrolipoyllysine-residue succinyltransferase component of 2-oxoglutarate dehydrogenase complex n=1 Tax=Empedobacter falsenii TaxID=343874 RepID=A0ABY8VAH4_9FLAO|nr:MULTISPECIES: 2-oxoglutarate dehydrogenase complex dihydrolipoyllysine-residue succinyltransferase [Empedobacter]MCA4776262.1 2-oxoglutarate dehydrogenase complex dihydrolipoyllysine-residue succinyltransferase [Empedobacter stercoris]MCA4782079.1 2-oxoglutarate dehydrogenase complex dihydrolipoyllysine-residue succinyltransferase [Empedobacter stercoris]MCA4808581.1 2-oxoglutarate dehydrogenase complex dihydrolipoyllysine-residue succinyltransferase [Empedobacter stercoris]MDM1522258.1 2-ox
MLEMKVPSPGESITEVEIATWLVKDGDYVEKDQAIAEVDSDKATLELPAEESGIITLKAEEGDVVEVGQVVCLIDTSAAKPAGGSAEAPKAEVKEEVKAAPAPVATPAPAAPATTYATGTPSPAAKKVLDEKGIDASQVKGSGRDGRITQDDAVRFTPAMGTSTQGTRAQSEKKLSSLRRKIAQRLVSVKNETAMLTTFNEVDMSAIFALRNQYKDEFKAKHGVGLGFMSFFTKAVTRALEMYPDVNSMIDGDYQVKFDFADVSVAVSGPKGLMVPVVRNAENLTFRGVEQSIKDLAIKVRDGKISVDEMTGGTFTITNGGVFGSMMSTPIINPPQSGILGMHNIVERPVVKNGQIVIAPMMYVALSYDHRIIDGRESVGFLVAVKEAVEDPLNVLMGGDAKRALEL